MAEHLALIEWRRQGVEFCQQRYSREHTWTFDGGLTVAASSSPSVVPLPWSNPAAVDPEEAFIASIASCHMLWWLSLAARAGFNVLSYRDRAVGTMKPNEQGRRWIDTVTLHPEIHYEGRVPTEAEAAALHHEAHESCFIANSVKTAVTVLPAAT